MGPIEGTISVDSPEGIVPLLSPLAALQRLLAHFNNRGIVIGGIAASLLGRPRLTGDADQVLGPGVRSSSGDVRAMG